MPKAPLRYAPLPASASLGIGFSRAALLLNSAGACCSAVRRTCSESANPLTHKVAVAHEALPPRGRFLRRAYLRRRPPFRRRRLRRPPALELELELEEGAGVVRVMVLITSTSTTMAMAFTSFPEQQTPSQ